MNTKIHRLINLKSVREYGKFALGYKGGMKQCHTRGCEIKTPAEYLFRGSDFSDVIQFEKMHQGEVPAKSWMW